MKDEMMTPYAILGSNGTMPDCFLVTLSAGQYSDAQLDILRRRYESESDEDFWNRTMGDVGSLLTPIDRMSTTGVVVVTCLYENRDFNDPIPFPIEVFES